MGGVGGHRGEIAGIKEMERLLFTVRMSHLEDKRWNGHSLNASQSSHIEKKNRP